MESFSRCTLLVWGLILIICSANYKEFANAESNYDYTDALRKSILFFEGQRSGKLPDGQRVTWRGDSALSDGKPDNVDLTGGYYDAGDNVKFGWPMSFTVCLLSWGAIEYEKDLTSVNELSHLRTAVKWGSDFLLKSHTSSTTLYTQVGDGNGDHLCWERPEDMDTPRTLYKITQNSPGSEPAADGAAALAAASMVFAYDSTYSATLLRHAKLLFDFADKYRASYTASCPFYCSYSGYTDELLWAAGWLYRATKDNTYLNYVLSNQGWSQRVNEFSWDNKFAGVQMLLAKEYSAGKTQLSQYKSNIDSFICALMPGSSSRQIKTTNGGLMFIRDSSNLQYATSATMLLFMHSNTFSGVDYILGKNPKSMSYMAGYGSKYPNKLHHRGASIPSIKSHPAKVGCNDGSSNYYNSPNPNPNVHVGAVVGGPDGNDQFSDSRSDYSHSEPTTYMNAAFVGSVSALVSTGQRDMYLSQINQTIVDSAIYM